VNVNIQLNLFGCFILFFGQKHCVYVKLLHIESTQLVSIQHNARIFDHHS